MHTALQPWRGLERRDIFMAFGNACKCQTWLALYNQAHQGGLNPPLPCRHRGENLRAAGIRTARKGKIHRPAWLVKSFFLFYTSFSSMQASFSFAAWAALANRCSRRRLKKMDSTAMTRKKADTGRVTNGTRLPSPNIMAR